MATEQEHRVVRTAHSKQSGDSGSLDGAETDNNELLPAVSTEDERVARIERYRFERGANDARNGEPPTEANAAYQRGYIHERKGKPVPPRAPRSEHDHDGDGGAYVQPFDRGRR